MLSSQLMSQCVTIQNTYFTLLKFSCTPPYNLRINYSFEMEAKLGGNSG